MTLRIGQLGRSTLMALALGLSLATVACQTPQQELETPDNDAEVEQPVEQPGNPGAAPEVDDDQEEGEAQPGTSGAGADDD